MVTLVYAQTWKVFTLKNTIELPSPAKHRAESFEVCLLILFLENSAVFSLYLRTCGRTSTCLHHSHQHLYTASTVVYTVTFINIMNVIPLLQLIIIIIIIIFYFYFLTGNIASNIIVGSTNANL